MAKVAPSVSEYMASLGKKSWAKRKKTQNMSELGKKSAEKRWGKKKTNEPIAKKPKETKKSSLNMEYEP
jgi:hypothetical protein